MNDWMGLWVGLGGFLFTTIALNFGIQKYNNSKFEKVMTYFNDKLQLQAKEHDDKINRVYMRFDEHKKQTEEKYVVKTLCKVMHENSSENLTGLETRLNQRFLTLEKKTDDNFKVVIDLMKK